MSNTKGWARRYVKERMLSKKGCARSYVKEPALRRKGWVQTRNEGSRHEVTEHRDLSGSVGV